MIGIHVSKSGSIWRAKGRPRASMSAAISEDLGESSIMKLNVAQIFTHGPRTMAASKVDYDDVKAYCQAAGVVLVVHATYLTPQVWTKHSAEKHLAAQMDSCERLGARGLVLHLPKLGADAIAARLKELVALNPRVQLLLEMTPSSMTRAESINELCRAARRERVPENAWSICVDTAHIWASGVDISCAGLMRAWLGALEFPQKIGLLHFNGCATPRGYGRDTHAIPWSRDDKVFGGPHALADTGAAVMVRWCLSRSIPMVMEINAGSVQAMRQCLTNLAELLREQARGRGHGR